MKSPFKKWLLGLISLFAVLAVVGCGGGWTGTGTVLTKTYLSSGFRSNNVTQKNTWHGECFELTIRDRVNNKTFNQCVSERVWNDAMLDHQITLTEEYK